MKKLTRILSLAALGAGLLFTPIKKASADDGFYFYTNGEINASFGTYLAKTETTPDYIRSVPPHPDDVKNNGVTSAPIIEDGPLYLAPASIGIKLGVGLGLREKKFSFELGPYANFSANGSFENAKDGKYNIREQDYEPALGHAYTYNSLGMSNPTSRLGIIPGASLRSSVDLLDNNLIKFFTEYSADWYKVFIETGWDRYNRLEQKDAYKIADIINHSIKIGFNFSNNLNSLEDSFKNKVKIKKYFELYGGITIPQIINKTSLVADTKFTMNPNVFFGTKLGIKFD
jgi:hypothetical protein